MINNFQKIFVNKPILIAGPCSAESEKQTIETAPIEKNKNLIFRAGI